MLQVEGGRGEWEKKVLLRVTRIELGGAGRLYPRVTIDALPDNVLLETFEFYLGKDDAVGIQGAQKYDLWQKLVHVCRRWRCIVFASPRRLDLKLYCTRKRSVNSKTLDIWPALPIVIFARDLHSNEDVTSVITALRQHNRVCRIHHYNEQPRDSLLKELAKIDEPFPALTSLELISHGQDVPVLPDSFLGRSAPHLQSLDLDGIAYPSIGKLLSSTTNLVRLSLWRIPNSGYLAPNTIVPCLSMLSRLESLALVLQHPRPRAHRASRHPPPLTRVVLTNLASLDFGGDMEYLEDILSQIETPMLNQSYFCFFNQLVFDTPLLGQYIRRTETFTTIHRASVQFFSWAVRVTFWGREEMADNDRKALWLEITCKPLDWQLSAIAQVLDSFSSSLLAVEGLEIAVHHEDWQGDIEVIQWRELLLPFPSVKRMSLKDEASVRPVARALRELAGEGETEVLPALQHLSLTTSSRSPSGPIKAAVDQYIATRQLHGHHLTVHYRDIESEE